MLGLNESTGCFLERKAGTGKYTKSNHGQSESIPIFLTFTHFCLVFYSVDVYSQQWLHNLFSLRHGAHGHAMAER